MQLILCSIDSLTDVILLAALDQVEYNKLLVSGHFMRLYRQTPVRLALFESLQPGRGNRGRPILTWIKLIEKYIGLKDIKLNLKDQRTVEEKYQRTQEEKIALLEGLAEDRNKWRKLVKDIMTVNH